MCSSCDGEYEVHAVMQSIVLLASKAPFQQRRMSTSVMIGCLQAFLPKDQLVSTFFVFEDLPGNVMPGRRQKRFSKAVFIRRGRASTTIFLSRLLMQLLHEHHLGTSTQM